MRNLVAVVGLVAVLGFFTPAIALASETAEGGTATEPKKAKKKAQKSPQTTPGKVEAPAKSAIEDKAATQSKASMEASSTAVPPESSQKSASSSRDSAADSGESVSPVTSEEASLEHGSGIHDTGSHQRSSKLSLFGIIPWWYGFGIGVGGRYELPLVPDGFIPTINDSFELEFGAEVWYASVAFSGGYTGVTVPVEGRWSFHLTPKMALYGKLGLGWSFYFWSNSFANSSVSGFHFNGATGAMYQLSDSFWFRGELGYTGLKLGVSLKF